MVDACFIHYPDTMGMVEAGTALDGRGETALVARLRSALAEAQRIARLGTWILTPQGEWTELSDEMLRLMQLKAQPDRAGFNLLLERTHPEDRDRLDAAFQRVRLGLPVPAVEHRLLAEAGRILWVVTRLKATMVRGERMALVNGSTQDITDLHQASSALRQTQQLESLGVLAGGLAQDFSGLTTQLMQRLAILRDRIPEDAAPVFREMQELLGRADRLAGQLQAYHATGDRQGRPLALDALVEAMSPLLEAILPTGAQLVLDLQTPLPVVDGREGPFRQVVLALVTNAAEALEGAPEATLLVATGTTRLDARRIERDFVGQGLEPGLYVTLDVRDTGCGMDAETLARAFEPFFTTRATGRGLGLTATRDILQQARAGISLASRPGDGTSVRVVFPASNARLPQAEIPTEPLPLAAPQLLVVDDDPILRQSAVEALEGRGYRVVQARDGEEAVEAFRRQPSAFDLVLLDVAMPRKDGLEAMEEILAIRSDARVVLCSGYHAQEVMGGEAGRCAVSFLPKPYRVRDLIQTVQGILSPEPAPPAPPGP